MGDERPSKRQRHPMCSSTGSCRRPAHHASSLRIKNINGFRCPIKAWMEDCGSWLLLMNLVLTACLDRFSLSISSTPARLPRPASTSSRCVHKPRDYIHAVYIVRTDMDMVIGSCARPPLVLHGRQVPRLLHHHHRLLPRPDRCHLPRMHHRSLPADRR